MEAAAKSRTVQRRLFLRRILSGQGFLISRVALVYVVECRRLVDSGDGGSSDGLDVPRFEKDLVFGEQTAQTYAKRCYHSLTGSIMRFS